MNAMSSQPTSLLMGSRMERRVSSTTASDFQVLVARVTSILSYRRWMFIIPLLSGLLIALLISLGLPRRYDLSTVFERRDDVVLTKLISSNSPYSFETIRRSLGFDLMGYHALAQAVDDLGLNKDFPRDAQGALLPEGRVMNQKLIAGLPEFLEVKILEKSTYLDLIQVRYTGQDPVLGQKLVSQLKDNYIARTRNYITDILHKSLEFFSTEAARRREKATTLETRLMKMSATYPGANPADPDVLSQRLMTVNMAIEDLLLRRSETESKLKSFQEYLAALENTPDSATPPAFISAVQEKRVPNPQHERLLGAIEQVKSQIADAKALRQMTDMHPVVVGLRDKLTQLQAQLEQEPDYLPADQPVARLEDKPAMASDPAAGERFRMQSEIKGLQELIVRVDQNLAKHHAEKQALEEDKAKVFERRQSFLVLQQEVQSAKADLRIWDDHVETVSRVMAAEEGQRGIGFSTVEKAQIPSRPSSPTLGGVFLLSGSSGLALAILVVFLREVFDRSFRDPARVRQSLGLPVLETIGEIRSGSQPVAMGRRLLLPGLAVVEGLVVALVAVVVYLNLQYPDVYVRVLSQVLPGRVLAVLG